jgi:hypothetical protein
LPEIGKPDFDESIRHDHYAEQLGRSNGEDELIVGAFLKTTRGCERAYSGGRASSRGIDMSPSPTAKRTIRYITERRDIEEIVRFEKQQVFHDPDNLLNVKDAMHWVNRYRKAICVQRDGDGLLDGFTRVAPISQTTFGEILASKGDVRRHLRGSAILSSDDVARNVIQGIGNYCAVCVVIYNAAAGTEGGYGEVAPGLLRELYSTFFRIRLEGLVCQSETTTEEVVITDSGCRQVADLGRSRDGRRIVWCFDEACAKARPFLGLGVVFHNLWPQHWDDTSLRLSTRERQVVWMSAQGYTDEQIASELGISASTVKKTWENAREKYRDLQSTDHVTRRVVIGYCEQHPVEWVIDASEAAALRRAVGVKGAKYSDPP